MRSIPSELDLALNQPVGTDERPVEPDRPANGLIRVDVAGQIFTARPEDAAGVVRMQGQREQRCVQVIARQRQDCNAVELAAAPYGTAEADIPSAGLGIALRQADMERIATVLLRPGEDIALVLGAGARAGPEGADHLPTGVEQGEAA